MEILSTFSIFHIMFILLCVNPLAFIFLCQETLCSLWVLMTTLSSGSARTTPHSTWSCWHGLERYSCHFFYWQWFPHCGRRVMLVYTCSVVLQTGKEWTVPGEFEKYASQTSKPVRWVPAITHLLNLNYSSKWNCSVGENRMSHKIICLQGFQLIIFTGYTCYLNIKIGLQNNLIYLYKCFKVKEVWVICLF